MYCNSYQSGHSIELFNPNSKELISNWKFKGKHYKTYDNTLRCSMIVLDSGGLSSIKTPIDKYPKLGIVQSYLVFQIYLFSSKQFSIEISISDIQNIKRRLLFSTYLREISSNYFSCLIPIVDISLGNWINLSIDVLSFVSNYFKFLTFKSIDAISFSANCKVRKIFTMRSPLREEHNTNSDDQQPKTKRDNKYEQSELSMMKERIPIKFDLPLNAKTKNVNLNVEKVLEQLKGNEEKKNERSIFPTIKTTTNQESLMSHNDNTFFVKENRRFVSPQIKYQNRHKNEQMRLSPNKIMSSPKEYMKAQSNNYLIQGSKMTNNMIQAEKNRHQKNSKDFIKNIQKPHIYLLHQKQVCIKTEKRYQDHHNTNGDLIGKEAEVWKESTLEKKKICNLNNVLYSKNDLVNSIESNHIEEINVYDSQIGLAQRNSKIIQIDDSIGQEYLKDQIEAKNQLQYLFEFSEAEKKHKKAILNEMLEEDLIIERQSAERPYSPSINNQIKD